MAHAAELNEANVVLRVLVIDDAVEQDIENWCTSAYGGIWKQTSYNGNMRKNFAGVGYTYDAGRDAFIPPKPFSSWTINEDTCRWDPPVPYPGDGIYEWNEEQLSWVLVG